MGRFHEDTAVVETDGVLTATLSKDWEIWGPNGGYVAAIALRAAGLRAPEGHRPASFSCQYLSVGKFAPAQAEVRVIKAGRSARWRMPSMHSWRMPRHPCPCSGSA